MIQEARAKVQRAFAVCCNLHIMMPRDNIYSWRLWIVDLLVLILLSAIFRGSSLSYLCIWGLVCQKQVSRTGTCNYIPQIPLDAIICPRLCFLHTHTHIILLYSVARASNDIYNPCEICFQLKPHKKISLVHTIYFSGRFQLKVCTEHDRMTVVLCAKFSQDSKTK